MNFVDRVRGFEAMETERTLNSHCPYVVRVDGHSFNKFTRNMRRPFDPVMADLMQSVMIKLVDLSGARVGYTQSDEITLVFDRPDISKGETHLFGGRVMKLSGIFAGWATAHFLSKALELWPQNCAHTLPTFDARVFSVPDRRGALDQIQWRQNDCLKNSISMAARVCMTAKEMYGLSGAEMVGKMRIEHNVEFAHYPSRFRLGIFGQKKSILKELSAEEIMSIPEKFRPTKPILRREVQVLNLPPINTIKNFEDVVFAGDDPVV